MPIPLGLVRTENIIEGSPTKEEYSEVVHKIFSQYRYDIASLHISSVLPVCSPYVFFLTMLETWNYSFDDAPHSLAILHPFYFHVSLGFVPNTLPLHAVLLVDRDSNF